MKIRIFVTIALLILWSWIVFISNIGAPLIAADLAGRQFEASNSAYVVSRFASLFTGDGPPTLILLGLLLWLWWRPIAGIIAALALLAALASPAHAYYDQSNYTEAYFILPNESAFFIPDVGDNKSSQVQFGSQEYFEQNKVPAKRFVIPHVKLENSGMWSNFYVPAGRLILLDRTPFNQEWTKAGHRGTSSKDESFPCQSKEGLNEIIEMAVAASVTETNASRFLYHFGVIPPAGDRTKPEVIFTSTFRGKSLTDVMQSVGRGEIQTLACQELSTHTLDDGNAKMSEMLASIQAKAKAWFADYGISIDYLGWAGTFTFDETVQKAIDDRYAAEKIAPVLQTLQAAADIKVKEGLGQGLEKHGLPASFVAIPTNLLDSFSALFKPAGGK